MRHVGGEGRERARAAGRARLGVPVGVVAEVTVMVNGMVLPNANVPPATGMVTVTVGLVFPAVIVVCPSELRPDESLTVRWTM